eukprot:TRINITY_DN10881_c0_g1_i1.p1 TRINITY_DN10881_c0_g1~~TRINITY_DN10881_c0_g1_i1.p1  ORF type:complete len:180 (+),score=55.85 TRINITY_DN10881_c0_g1_i1:70-609(+)
MERKVVILYGSQTGCAQEVAERLHRDFKRLRFHSRVVGMDQYDKKLLPTEKMVIMVTSTTGQGEVPDNMRSFWRFLLTKSLPSTSLIHTRFAVFGLGDSSYLKYNYAAKRLNQRLIDLGGIQIIRRGDGDDQHELGLDYGLEKWSSELFSAVMNIYPLPSGISALPKDTITQIYLNNIS